MTNLTTRHMTPLNGLSYIKFVNDGNVFYIDNGGTILTSYNTMLAILKINKQTFWSEVDDKAVGTGFNTTVTQEDGTKKTVFLHGVQTLGALAKKYNPELNDKFGDAGATMYLYQLAGYKITVKPIIEYVTEYRELPATQESLEAFLRTANITLLAEMVDLASSVLNDKLKVVSEQAGLVAKVNSASKLSGEKVTLRQMLNTLGITDPVSGSIQEYGRKLAASISNDTLEAIEKVESKTRDSKGRWCYSTVNNYPVECLQTLENIINKRS